MTDAQESPDPGPNAVAEVARDFAIFTVSDIIAIQNFFKVGKNGVLPERVDVALYMLVYGVAASVRFPLKLLPIARDDIPDTPWAKHIDRDHTREIRRCRLHVTLDETHAHDLDAAIEEILIPAPPSHGARKRYKRQWTVSFGAYVGILNLDDPMALRAFYACAAQEIILRISANA